jgi:hypothetical protein
MPERESTEPNIIQPVMINCPLCGGRHPRDGEHAEFVPLAPGRRTVHNLLRQGRVIS